MRANELEDNFSYNIDENIKANEDDIKDINVKNNNFKSKYYNLS